MYTRIFIDKFCPKRPNVDLHILKHIDPNNYNPYK